MYLFIFSSKKVYPIVRQLEKITMKKAQAKVVKCTENNSWVSGSRNPPSPIGHLSVNIKMQISE